MLPAIARHLICPIHELLVRRRTFGCLRELERSQWFAPSDLKVLQQTKLQALLRHARANTRFYRRRFEAVGVDVDGEDPFDVLGRLPVLSKDEIRTSIDDMIWHDAPGGLIEYNTGGSTGEPLIFYFDRRRQAYDQAGRLRSHRWFGVDVGDRELYLWGSPIESNRTDSVRRMRDALFNHRLLSAFDMSERRMDEYLDEFDRFRPAGLYGYPSSIALLIDHARRRGRRLDTRSLRAVFVTGEVCFAQDREAIESYFGVPVADGYGAREVGFIAHECRSGGMHLTTENIVIEIIDQRGRPLPAGEVGEIILTQMDCYAMPMIRYRTGDVGRLKPGRCACGRGLPLMDVVQGRTTDFLYLPDGTVRHALSIIYPLREMAGVRQFSVTQHEDYSVTVDVAVDDRIARITREAVVSRVRPVLGDEVDLCVHLVERITQTESGKHRFVISHAQPAGRRISEEATAGV